MPIDSKLLVAAGILASATVALSSAAVAGSKEAMPVSGSGVHYFSGAIVHSQTPTEQGMIQRSTEIVRLDGDLDGYVLYQPVSTFDFVANTLVNSAGAQFFSGTVLGSEPMILYDAAFRFEVDLSTGATTGEVHLGRSNDAPHSGAWYECDLEAVGTGLTPEGDAMFDYTGTCVRRGR